MGNEGIEPRTLKCAVLFLDLRDSTRKIVKFRPEDVADQMLALLDKFWSIVDSTAPHHRPDFVKSVGDGLMCVWHLDNQHNGTVDSLRVAILSVASELHRTLGERLREYWNNESPRIGIGLTCGVVTLVDGDVKDYFGFPASLAAKLQDAARPEGFVVQYEYFIGLPKDLAREHNLRRQAVGPKSPLSKLDVAQCYITRGVRLAFDWTCLAWPGLAITYVGEEDLPQNRPTPVGLNTKGITVVTHEGIQGNIGTLEIWPRHESREEGDPFEIIIDDFDALSIMYRQSSIKPIETEELRSGKINAVWNMICGGLRKAEEIEPFLFIPIRCGINALAANKDKFADVQAIRHYSEILDKITSKQIVPSQIGLYDNIGATLPILLLTMGGVERKDVYSITEGHLKNFYKKFKDLTTNYGKFPRCSKIENLAFRLQSHDDIALVLGGGAWLGSPNLVPGCQLQFHVPEEDGGFLWVEGATVTSSGTGETELLVEFLTSTVLEDDYQWGLANGRPYGSSPVCTKTITQVLNSLSREIDGASAIDAETARIYPDSQHISANLTHRKCPMHFPAWLETWNRIVTECCYLVR